MDSEKPKFNWQRMLITSGFVLLAALVVGGTTWYVMDKSAKEIKTANDSSVASLQKQINELKAASKTSTVVTAPATTVLTSDQIFQEVSTKFNFSRSEVTYFRIWDQDKVQYSLLNAAGVGSGTAFAYEPSGTWINILGGQGVNDCSVYSNIPEAYRPICTKGTDSTLYYANSDSSSTNYPVATATHYIGE